ncbi:MAG: hypothetical protein AB1393_04260 [Candidatus Edwardsbacteria bacterium]
MVKFLAGGKQTLPMELAEGNCHAESVAGSKGSSARTQVVSAPATITLSGLDWMIDFIFEFQGYGLKVV